MKLCLIYNGAAHYREAIFRKIDEEFCCDFVFGIPDSDVKQINTSNFKGVVTYVRNSKEVKGFYYQFGVVPFLFSNKYTHYILLGEPFCISTWVFCLLSRLFCRKKKLYFWTHGWYGKEDGLKRIIKKCFFYLPNGGIFTYGNYARELMIKEGFNASRIHPIHNSLAYDKQIEIRKTIGETDVYKEHFGNENHNLFFVGRLTSVKRLDLILDALVICNQKGNKYNFTFIGGGSESDRLKTKASELGLDKQVWFYGPCYDEKVLSSLIYNADLCIAPGNIGLTAMHSMVFGTPCLTHNDFAWQMPEFEVIKPYKTGCFFKRNDVIDLAERIDEWFKLNGHERDYIRKECMNVIDTEWTPYYQINILKDNLK